MKTVKGICLAIILTIGGGWMILHALTIHIGVGQVGVRIQQYGLLGNKGVVERDFGPGWHRDLGPIDNWEVFDSTVQSLEMTGSPLEGSRVGHDEIKVQSADGYAIALDVTVKFRIKEGLAHRLYQDTGSGIKYKTIVRNEAERACMGFFGKMKTEDFYNPEQRRRTADLVVESIADALEDNYIEVADILIRDVQFDPEYENKIRAKKLADQEVQLNESMAAAERAGGQTQVIEAETAKLVQLVIKEKEAELVRMQAQAELTVETIQAEAGRYAKEKQADADLIAAQKEAQGTRLLKVAEAEGEQLRNAALAGSGGNVIVALEAARNLNLREATISTLEIDLLDVDGMVGKLGLGPEEADVK